MWLWLVLAAAWLLLLRGFGCFEVGGSDFAAASETRKILLLGEGDLNCGVEKAGLSKELNSSSYFSEQVVCFHV